MIKATNDTVKLFKLLLYLRIGRIDLHKNADWRDKEYSKSTSTPIPHMELEDYEHQIVREAYIQDVYYERDIATLADIRKRLISHLKYHKLDYVDLTTRMDATLVI